jgi:DNA adenine methylase
MPITDSPLRYPGGKTQLAPLIIDILKKNRLLYGSYVEPFVGGAGLALKLLLNSYVSEIHINDLDRAIYAFWHSVLNNPEELCFRIESTKVNVGVWRKQRKILDRRYSTLVDLGFAALFLNRTNRSGIIRGGIIGGLDQSGNFKIDCRFNRVELIRKIRRIAAHKSQIHLSRLDALTFLTTKVPTISGPTLVNLDPPYIKKGPDLYRNHYTPDDHAELAKAVGRIRQRWMVTYDDTPTTRKLYRHFPCFTHELNYMAQVKRVGVELLVLDPQLKLPACLDHHEPLAA